ncbi:Protein of unknown function [Clostridium amylolyticum]|uniref:TNT domain-containing protein n=1 Tax=Clostridium amylolyticum TaxID=1121298 RepID=A0A1M6J5M0_9CLOT|nr:TNT domain-containing protein [Clostridium amylolyticum]SHJ41911.1 Protein of unknown function [Clostridium amylolyticum]
MVIKVNITELESKAKYASSLAKQLKWKADEINDLYYSVDSEVKNRNGIGQSMLTLQRNIERAQQRMYNISEFLSSAAERYHKAETLVVAKSRNIGMVSSVSTISRDFGTVGAATVGATTALEDRNIDTNTGAVKGKGEGKKWYQSNFFKLAVGVVVVGGAIALACTVGGPILVGMAVGAATGAAYGGLLGGVSSYISGGDFMNGFSDGFMWGGISGAISGAVSAKGIGMLGTAFADGAVDSAIYVGETKLNGGEVSAMGVMSSFAMGMGISYWGSSRAVKKTKVSPEIRSGTYADLMSSEDAKRYNQFWDYVENGLSVEDRVKLSNWNYKPNAELYNKYKTVYDNPKYYDQINGSIHWPGTNGDTNLNGFLDGKSNLTTLEPGKVIDRFGNPSNGYYLSPEGVKYEQRALAPHCEKLDYHKYKVILPLDVESGIIAPWFDQPGGGIQYFTSNQVLDFRSGNMVEATVENLLDIGYIIELK